MSLTKVSFSMIEGSIINVVDYGAVGDGVTDNTAFFLAAKAAAITAKSTVIVPSGTYILQSATDLSADDTDWYFQAGSVLKLSNTQATTSFITFSSPVNQRVFGMRVNANRPVQNPVIFGGDNCAVLVVDADNCTFDGVEIINSPGKGFALVSTPSGFNRDVSILNFTGADCKEQVLLVDGNNRLGFFERIIIDGVKIGATGNFGLCLNDGAGQVTVSNVIAEIQNSIGDAVYIRDSFDLQLSNIRGSSGQNGLGIERVNGFTGRIELSNVCGEFNDQNGILIIGAENVTATSLAGCNNGDAGINISQNIYSERSKNINISNCSVYDNRVSPQQDYGLLISAADSVRVGELIAYGNTIRNLSILRATTSNIVAPTRQVISGSTGSIAANASALITLNWPIAFDDAFIDIDSAYVFVSSSSLNLSVTSIAAITQNAVQVIVKNLSGTTAFTGTLTVIGSRTV